MHPSAPFQTIGIISRPRRANLAVVVPALLHWCEARGIRVLYDTETASSLNDSSKGLNRVQVAEESQLLLVLGGDGTLLAAARVAAPLGPGCTRRDDAARAVSAGNGRRALGDCKRDRNHLAQTLCGAL